MSIDVAAIRARAELAAPIESLMRGSDDQRLLIYHRGRRWEECAFYWRARADVLALCDEIDRLSEMMGEGK